MKKPVSAVTINNLQEKRYALVQWAIADIKAIRPNWTDEQCAEWLDENEGHIQDRMIEIGWEVIKDLL